jgi:hypothetical protein
LISLDINGLNAAIEREGKKEKELSSHSPQGNFLIGDFTRFRQIDGFLWVRYSRERPEDQTDASSINYLKSDIFQLFGEAISLLKYVNVSKTSQKLNSALEPFCLTKQPFACRYYRIGVMISLCPPDRRKIERGFDQQWQAE